MTNANVRGVAPWYRGLWLAAVLTWLGCSSSSSDESGGRVLLYVANTGSTTVSVIDHGTRAVVETIDLGGLPHGQIPSHAGDRLYVTTEDTGEVIAIDTSTQTVLWRVRGTERDTDELHQPSITLDDRIVFAPDLLTFRLVMIDTSTGMVDGAIEVIDQTNPSDPMPLVALHNSYLSGDGRFVYVEGILSQRVAKVDIEAREVVRTYVVPGDPRPIAILSDQSRMYVQLTDLEGFVEIDLDTGNEVNRIEWSNTASETWQATDARLKPKSHGVGLTPDETELWATSTMADRWYVYSVPELEQLAVIDIQLGNAPNWIAFTPDGAYAYVTNTTWAPGPDGEPSTDVNGTVTVIDTATRQVVDTIEVGPLPKRIHMVEVPD